VFDGRDIEGHPGACMDVDRNRYRCPTEEIKDAIR
jgi:hypothetical protein